MAGPQPPGPNDAPGSADQYEHYALSNGQIVWVPKGTSPDDVKSSLAAEEEGIRSKTTGGQARQAVANAVPTTGLLGDYVNTMKRAVGNAADFVAPAASYVGGVHIPLTDSTVGDAYKEGWRSSGRILAHIPGTLDVLPHAYNVARHVFGADPSGNLPEGSVYRFGRDFMNLPEASSGAQQFGESALAGGVAGGAGLLGTAVGAGASAAGGYGGRQLGDAIDPSGKLGDVLELGGGLVGGNRAPWEGALRVGNRILRDPRAADIATAGQRQDIPVSTQSLMNPQGQTITKFFGSIPATGQSIARENTRTSQGIEAIKNDVAQQLSGGTRNPQTGRVEGGTAPETPATKAEVGAAFQQGTRNAVVDAKQQENQAWSPVNQILDTTDANAAPILSATNEALSGNKTTPDIEDAIRGKVERNITAVAPGGPRYDTSRGPVPQGPVFPRPTVEVPGSLVKDFRTDIREGMGNDQLNVPGHIEVPIKDATTAVIRDAVARTGANPDLVDYAEHSSQVANNLYNTFKPSTGRLFGQEFGEPTGGDLGAYTQSNRILHDPTQLTTTADAMRPEDWGNYAGHVVTQWGNRSGDFRPEHFAESVRNVSPQSREVLLNSQTDAQGNPINLHQPIQDAATVAENVVPAPERQGLQRTVVLSSLLGHGVSALAGGLGDLLTGSSPAHSSLVAGASGLTLPWLISRGLTSDAMKRTLAGTPPTWGQIASDLPVSANVAQQLYSQPQQQQPDLSQAPQGMFP